MSKRRWEFPLPEVREPVKPPVSNVELARTWWSRRFIEVLTSFGMAEGLRAGRRAVRAGQVLGVSLSTSLVLAQVRDAGGQVYRARIAVKAFDAVQWRRVEQALAGQAIYAAKLLAGEMPGEIEELLAGLGVGLFPATSRELSMDCSCPSWQVPCEHLAAVCYRLAESFDADPFQILAWRGRDRAALLDRLGELRGDLDEPAVLDAVVPLADQLAEFWSAPSTPVVPASVPSSVLEQLAPIPVPVTGGPSQDLRELLRPAYRALRDS